MSSCSLSQKVYSVWWPEGAPGRFVLYTKARIVNAECKCRDDLPATPSLLREAYDAHVSRGEENLVHIMFSDSGEEGVCPLEWFGRDLRRAYRVRGTTYTVKYALDGAAAHEWRSLQHPEWLTKKDVQQAEREEEDDAQISAVEEHVETVECKNGNQCSFGRFFPRETASPLSPDRDDFSDWTCPECIVMPLAIAMEM